VRKLQFSRAFQRRTARAGAMINHLIIDFLLILQEKRRMGTGPRTRFGM
jgi:hypothetical protein